ncbi:MAG: pyridoxamine 5'-phosphate oxidase family protein [Tardiphaga sp.]
MKQEFKRQIVELLDSHRIMTIATNRPDGWPQATIVGYANDGLLIYCFIGRKSQKFDNIARDSRVSIAIGNDYPQPLQIKGLSLAAHVTALDDEAEIDRAMELLQQRYPEYADMPRPTAAEVAVLRAVPEIVSILDYAKGFAHTDLVNVADADLPQHLDAQQHRWLALQPA